MELILNSLISDDLTEEQKRLSLDFLQDILQSNTKDYESYFSSRAVPGSITEDIAEIDAELSALDRKIRKSLLDNKSQIIVNILENDDRAQLDDIAKSLEQLWELDININKAADRNVTNDDINNESVSIDDFLEDDKEDNDTGRIMTTESNNLARKKKEDEFHKALSRLRNRISTKEDDKDDIRSDTLVTVLENLDSITDLMELPFLARTCIRTGHYQEAVMLYTHTTSLRSRFPGSTIVDEVCEKVLNEISTTMLSGLVKLLSTNVSVNSLKKILQYLNSIPPFDGKTNKSLLSVFLAMRYKFITDEIASYPLDVESSNESLIEMMVKRKIEVLREHVYMSLNVFLKSFLYDTNDLEIPFPEELESTVLRINGTNEEKEIEEKEKETKKEEYQKQDSVANNEEDVTENKSIEDVQEEVQGKVEGEDDGAERKTENEIENETVNKTEDKAEKGKEEEEINKVEVTPEEPNKSIDNKAEKEEEEINKVEVTPEEPSKKIRTSKRENKIPTNAVMLQFVDKCITYVLKDLTRGLNSIKLSDSVCLQLVYCSFRLCDLNRNYHHLFLKKINDTSLFTTEQLARAIDKRAELASKYIYS
ncbi:BAQ_1a_G0039700.mRNA.1.CDS.1 [Saccharomyces cerevisiae]|nr:BAQ_1a_G0039700.mRNA.1.CDS.1 [Saccharomyces cerevisiae]CAI4682939.1 BAM_G0039690.mRNA.1.CDS.1 [Saccharomyces cerevisiae]CAI7257091.1 BAM_G0039690.mRNA.1.CDS.1 [Saccharomyces cerevisiae]CAI7258352.1 BAQ_1a_G0039700.mRNA.1.CDS.1 [Saccharomyces cerevisiae]